MNWKCHDLVRSQDALGSNNAIRQKWFAFKRKFEFSRLQILDPFVSTITIETESGTMETPGENLTAVSASLLLFAPAARCLSSDFYHCGVSGCFANDSFANVLGRFANVLSRFANVLRVNSPTSVIQYWPKKACYWCLESFGQEILNHCHFRLTGFRSNAARGRRPRAAFSSPRSQFFTIRTDPKPVNNLFIFFLL